MALLVFLWFSFSLSWSWKGPQLNPPTNQSSKPVSLREQITPSEPATSLTLDSIKPKIREQKESESKSKSTTPAPSDDAQQQHQPASEAALKSPEELEEEAGQEAAFNPETGEINWDCPCLGGMAHGPCGEEFKAAFSCFVYSTEEPKGIDCIEKFKFVIPFPSFLGCVICSAPRLCWDWIRSG